MEMTRRQAAAVAALLAAGFLVQAWFLTRYPQPILFGDPAGYYAVGGKILDSLRRLAAGEPVRAAVEPMRLLLPLLGVGTVFAALETVRPGDLPFFRMAMAAGNTLGMLGAFLLARHLSGTFAGGVFALVLAILHPSFPTQTGRLYPDPVTGCLFVWAAWLFVEGVERRRARWLCASGFTLSLGLFIRSQLMEFVPLVVAAALIATARAWWRVPHGRRMVAAFVIGTLPLLGAWAGVQRAVAGNLDAVDQLGNFTFRQWYPYGFWQFLDTDGWIGPYRLKQEPYYTALAQAAEGDPDLLRNRPRQLAFTAGYVASRGRESALLVLDNAYRLHDRPPNDYKWDYPMPYAMQVAFHRVMIVLAAAGMAVFVAERPWRLGAFLVPLLLTVLHGLAFPWPRYAQPGMLTVIAAAGGLVGFLLARRGELRAEASAFLRVLAVAVVFALLGPASFDAWPAGARVLRVLAAMAAVSALFALLWPVLRRTAPRRGPLLLGATLAGLVLLMAAHAVRDLRWHETEVVLGGRHLAVEQEILLTPEALGRLRTAAETFVVLDLEVAKGDLQDAEVTVGGVPYPGGALQPTMPRLRESTATARRDRRAYPQWWALRLDPAALPRLASEPLRVALRLPSGERVRLRADRFAAQGRVYEGPAFGEWPNLVALKLEYDGDYRIARRYALGSLGTRSFVAGGQGERRQTAAVHRVRLITLAQDEGLLEWTLPAPDPGEEVAYAFPAWAGQRGEAELLIDDQPRLRFPLGARSAFDVSGGGWRLCHRPEGIRGEKPYGTYVLRADAGGPPGSRAVVRYRSGMSNEPLYFVLDRKRTLTAADASDLPCAADARVIGAGLEVVDATRNNYPEDTGRWTVAAVY